MSKYLIALLSYGGVPNEYFMNLLKDALEDAPSVQSSKRAALRGDLHCLSYGFLGCNEFCLFPAFLEYKWYFLMLILLSFLHFILSSRSTSFSTKTGSAACWC